VETLVVGTYALGIVVSVSAIRVGDALWDATRVVRLGVDGCVLVVATTEISLPRSRIVASIVEEMLI
jgi:hypothetical protein